MKHHPDVQKYIDLFREAAEKAEKQTERDPFTVSDDELEEIKETGNIPYFLKYQALRGDL